jgi:hypothetical protein
MPKISTYTNASPIIGSDRLIGSDANSSNMTKNFLISDLTQYVIGQIPTSGNGLQNVLNNGNTATQDINLTGEINLVGDLYVTGTFKDSSASVGTSGQFLKSTSTGTIWAGSPTLDEVLTAGATSAVNVTLTGTLYSTEARIIKLRDYLNSAGTSGQVLYTTGTQVYWGNVVTPNIDQVLAVGTTTTRAFTTTNAVSAGNFTATNYVKPNVILDRLNSPGVANQILKSTNTGVEWSTASLTPQDLASVLAVGSSATSNMSLTGDLSVSGIATLGKIKDGVASVGTAGQVLSSTGSALSWITLPSTPTLSQVLAAGNIATNSITLTGSINMSGTLVVGGTVKPLSITDSTNVIGTSGQILSSTGTDLRWINPASTPTLTQVLTAGNITTLDITTTGFMRPTTIKDSLGNVGTSGQVLTSTGTAMLWSAVYSTTVARGSFYSNVSQSVGAINTATAMTLNNTDTSVTQNVSVLSSSHIVTSTAGVHNIQFSAQLDRVSGSGTDTVDIWFRKNGVDIPNSNSKIVISGTASNAKTLAAWNLFVNMAISDYIEIMWSSTSTNIQLITAPVNGVHPETPSLIVTINKID